MKRQIAINVGCGQTPTKDWINFDNSASILLARIPLLVSVMDGIGRAGSPSAQFIRFARQNDIRYANAAKRLPLADSTVDIVYSSHMVEHLDRDEVARFLGQVMRVLRPGGVLRLAVPDISKLVDSYLTSRDADKFIESTHMCQPRPRTLLQRLKLGVFGPRHHNWMYDGTSLSKLLVREGFVALAVLPPGETTISDPGALNLFERHDESVYVEARKPA